MRILGAAVLAVKIILSPLLLAAETPAPSPEAVNNEKIVTDDLMLFELEMAENGMTINQSLDSKVRVLSIYEKILVKRCLSETFNTLARSGPATDKICLDFAGRSLKIDAGNVVAICVREGIDSDICRIASASQNLIVYDPEAEARNSKASLDEVVALKKDFERIQNENDNLESALQYVVSDPKRGIDAKTEKIKIVKQLLLINCTRPRIKLGEEPKTDLKASPTKKSSLIASDDENIENTDTTAGAKKTPDAFDLMMQKHFATPTPSVEAPKSLRSYEITRNCSKQITRAFELDPNMALAICYKWGNYSWQCLNAIRAEVNSKPSGGTTNFSKPGGNIQQF